MPESCRHNGSRTIIGKKQLSFGQFGSCPIPGHSVWGTTSHPERMTMGKSTIFGHFGPARARGHFGPCATVRGHFGAPRRLYRDTLGLHADRTGTLWGPTQTVRGQCLDTFGIRKTQHGDEDYFGASDKDIKRRPKRGRLNANQHGGHFACPRKPRTPTRSLQPCRSLQKTDERGKYQSSKWGISSRLPLSAQQTTIQDSRATLTDFLGWTFNAVEKAVNASFGCQFPHQEFSWCLATLVAQLSGKMRRGH